MAGFGIQKKGTSPLLVKRKGFESGGDVDEAPDPIEKRSKPLPFLDPIEKRSKPLPSLEEKKPKTFSEGVKEGVKQLGKQSSKIVKDVAKKIEPGTVNIVKKSIEEGEEKSKIRKKTKEYQEKLKEETPAEMKKGGSVKKGILIIIGNKDKKSKGMKKGGLAKQAAIAIAMKKAGKKPKGMKK